MKELYRKVDQELFHAAEEGNISEAEKLFNLGADALARNSHHTVLHSAVLSDNESLLMLFLDKIKQKQGNVTPFINAKDTEGDTPLMWAAESKYVNAARILLEYGADIEAKNNDGMTALHWAAKNNHIEVIKLLLGKGAEVNVKDKHGKKPSDYAREEGRKEMSIESDLSEYMYQLHVSHGKRKDTSEIYLSHVGSSSKSHQEVQKLDEEYLVPKRDELEAIKKDITDHLEGRLDDVYSQRGKDRGMSAWHFAFIDTNKKEKYLEESKTGSLDIADYGTILKSGWGENVPKEIRGNIAEFFEKTLSNEFFVIKDNIKNMCCYHYVKIDTDKRELFLEQTKEFLPLERKIENCGLVLYSGWGQDPPENISNKLISTYFGRKEKKLEEKFAKLSIEESKTLHDAARDGELETLRGFVRANTVDTNGWTSLHHAAFVANIDAVKFIVSIGANLKVKDAIIGRMPVHIAAKEGHKDIIEFLLNKSLEIYDVDENSWTPLHYATWGGHLSLTKLFIEKRFDIHAKEATRGKKPIHIAADRGHKDIVDLFLHSGVEIDDTDRDGRTSLYYAAWKGHLDIVKYLAGRGANIHARNIFERKPVHVASFYGHINIIQFLLDRGANVDDSDEDNYTPLHLAAFQGQLGAVEFLLKHGANVNAINKNNRTPLHEAAEKGALETVKFLLKKGANIKARNVDHKTPLDLAREKGHLDVIDVLDG